MGGAADAAVALGVFTASHVLAANAHDGFGAEVGGWLIPILAQLLVTSTVRQAICRLGGAEGRWFVHASSCPSDDFRVDSGD